MLFQLEIDYQPRGDQGTAIEELVRGIEHGEEHQVLLGVTGSGKTFTMAKVIEATEKPALIMAHNKILAAQLYQEFKTFFPRNAVEYFVSYYDYYQPEAYVPASDTYIEKEATTNEELDKLRMSATRSLFERRDAVIIASVSCIYGLGSPEAYYGMLLMLEKGQRIERGAITSKLVEILYERNDSDFKRGTFRVRGDVIELWTTYDDDAYRIELWGDEVEGLSKIDPLLGQVKETYQRLPIYPKSHYVMTPETREQAIISIERELEWWHKELEKEGKLVEAQRLWQRTQFDLEMIRRMGFCHGIENYSRHFSGRLPGEPPPTLLDYLPADALLFIDESHQTVPQIGGMYHGDRSRKTTLVNYGFRMPSALDNRPLTFEEFENRVHQTIYVSATPGPYELKKTAGVVVEQIIRPTGLVDPRVEVRPVRGQVDDLLGEIRARVERQERVLITTLTKRMAEDLHEYYAELGVKNAYMHSEVATLDRVKILRDLRRGDIDALIGVNLLREGPGPAGGDAGGHSGRRQRGFSALGRIVDPDDRAGGAQCEWDGDSVRRHDDGQHAAGDRRDGSAAARAGGLQRGERNYASKHCESDRYDACSHRRGGLRNAAARQRRGDGTAERGSAQPAYRGAGEPDAGSRENV